MKIECTNYHYDWRELESVCSNATVKFECTFHQDMRPGDIFLILKTCDSYKDQHRSTRDKTAVVNLRTAKLSFVGRCRRVRIVQAKVVIE